jgi:hypothetical protein
LTVVFAASRPGAALDLEAVEMLVRGAMHRAGAGVLSRLLAPASPSPAHSPCACGHAARYHDRRPKQLLTALGRVRYRRAYYVCPHCEKGHSPRDRELDVEGVSFSPAVRRMMAAVGSESSFEQGREQLALLAGIEVPAKAVERHAEAIGVGIEAVTQSEIRQAKQLDLPAVAGPAVPLLYIEMDGTGVPTVKAETQARAGKIEGQPAHTREAKLGCVFTQSGSDSQGRPLRDPQSTSYVGAIETAEEFGLRLYSEAWRRGWSRAQKKVVIGDGALWIWNLAHLHFPGAIEIVDLYHARQHLAQLSAKLFGADGEARQGWLARTQELLDSGRIEELVSTLRELQPESAGLHKLVLVEAEYFERNAERMRYPAFREQGLFVGSGVIEAGCKTVIGNRLKRSGMFWTVRGANAILALRCCRLSGRFEDYWADRPRAA